MAKGDEIKKGAEFCTVMSALPAAHIFKLAEGRTLTINGRPESRFVGDNAMPLEGNQHGETKGVKVEDWKFVIEKYGKPNGKPEKGLKFLNSGVMFAVSDNDEKKGKKKELKDLKTGLEQLNPKKRKHTKPAEKDEDK